MVWMCYDSLMDIWMNSLLYPHRDVKMMAELGKIQNNQEYQAIDTSHVLLQMDEVSHIEPCVQNGDAEFFTRPHLSQNVFKEALMLGRLFKIMCNLQVLILSLQPDDNNHDEYSLGCCIVGVF